MTLLKLIGMLCVVALAVLALKGCDRAMEDLNIERIEKEKAFKRFEVGEVVYFPSLNLTGTVKYVYKAFDPSHDLLSIITPNQNLQDVEAHIVKRVIPLENH